MPPASGKGSPPRSKRVFLSNLQSFFSHVAPGLHLTKAAPEHSAYHLSELWESLEDASAFGVEVPIKEEWQDDGVTQVYAPYLSALQLFGVDRFGDRLMGYGSDEDSCTDLTPSEDSSAGSSASSTTQESEEETRRILPPYAEFHRARAGLARSLIFEHFERSSPHSRPPLTDQIRQIAEESCPQVASLSSSELHPYSWLAIAWYPIYRIPAGRTLHDLSACFLTYHSLAAPLPIPRSVSPDQLPRPQHPLAEQPAGADGSRAPQDTAAYGKLANNKALLISAPLAPVPSKGAAAVLEDRRKLRPQHQAFLMPFGFVPCKAVGRVWADKPNAAAHAAMLAAALAWTQQLGVQHPDQLHFTRQLGNMQWNMLS